MEISTTQRLTPVTLLQLMQINSEAISIMGIDYPEDVLSPLVSTDIQYQDDIPFLNIKIIALVPKGTPGKDMQLFFDESAPAGEFLLLACFENNFEEVSEYDVWYLSCQHRLRKFDEIAKVYTYLIDIKDIDGNPKTKRGTVNQVLES